MTNYVPQTRNLGHGTQVPEKTFYTYAVHVSLRDIPGMKVTLIVLNCIYLQTLLAPKVTSYAPLGILSICRVIH